MERDNRLFQVVLLLLLGQFTTSVLSAPTNATSSSRSAAIESHKRTHLMDISNLVEERHHAEGEKRRRLPSINPSSTSTYPTALPPFSHISTLPPINYQWTWIDRVNSWIDSVTESVPISKENIQRAIQSQKAAVAAAVSLSSSPIELSFSRGLESEKSLKVNVSLLMSKQSNLFRVGLMRLMASLQKSTQISGDVVYSTVRLFDMYVSSRSTTIDLKSKMEIRGLISACVFLAAKYRTDDQLAGSDLQLMYTLQLSGSMLTLYLKYSNELVEMLQVHQKITEDVSIPSPMSFFRHYTYFFECNHGKLSKNVKLKAITLFDKSLAIMPTDMNLQSFPPSIIAAAYFSKFELLHANNVDIFSFSVESIAAEFKFNETRLILLRDCVEEMSKLNFNHPHLITPNT